MLLCVLLLGQCFYVYFQDSILKVQHTEACVLKLECRVGVEAYIRNHLADLAPLE